MLILQTYFPNRDCIIVKVMWAVREHAYSRLSHHLKIISQTGYILWEKTEPNHFGPNVFMIFKYRSDFTYMMKQEKSQIGVSML